MIQQLSISVCICLAMVGRLTLTGEVPALADEIAKSSAITAEQRDFFERRIRPVLVEQCFECHSGRSKEIQGGLRLDSRAGVVRGGDSGPVVVSGKPDESRLVVALRHSDPDLKMPPAKKLKDEVIADFERWVRDGAPDPRDNEPPVQPGIDFGQAKTYWAFQPVKAVTPPQYANRDWPLNAVDRFVLAKLDAHGLHPIEDADRRTLIRRVSHDLIGLPPSPDEVDEFVSDPAPDAYERLVDRLLASPQYGERWGRHWMDVIRYADTAGDNSDYPIPQMYRYRNWIIEALNADQPYDEFIREQLAGDLLPATDDADRQRKIIATGYLANSKRFGSRVDDYPWHLTIEDTIDNLGHAFLGLSLNCARCHDHKFDPIRMEDYYGLYGIFQSTRYPWPGIELDKGQRDLVPLASADFVAKTLADRKSRLAEFDAEIKRLLKDANGNERDEKVKTAKQSREDFSKTPLPFEVVYAVADGEPKKIGPAKMQMKGDPNRTGDEVPRAFPEVLGGQKLAREAKHSGRTELANWITDARNPLTARVMVNRLWHYHFGRGLVPTPSDFGKQGQPPTHPELLDWLASELMACGLRIADSKPGIPQSWTTKRLHRLLVTSRVYRLASRDDSANVAIDPSNEWLWKSRRRRLDAESLRDTLLLLSGQLDRTPGGEHPFPQMPKWDFTQHKPFKAVYETNRRSVYLMTQRIQRHPYLAIFDGPDPNFSAPARVTSTTTLQALYFLNDPFVHDQCAHVADRVLSLTGDDSRRLTALYGQSLGRAPSADEQTRTREFLESTRTRLIGQGISASDASRQAWQSLVRALLRGNEFLYLE